MINQNTENKSNGLVYMINEYTKILQQHQYKKGDKEVNMQQQHCKQLVYICRDFEKAKSSRSLVGSLMAYQT